MEKGKEEITSEEEKLNAGDIGIGKHVGNLLSYMQDELKDCNQSLEDRPEEAKKHIWLDVKAISDWIWDKEKKQIKTTEVISKNRRDVNGTRRNI